MKIRFPQAALGLFLSLSAFSSCTPDIDFEETASDILAERHWTVDHYYEGSDRTSEYAPYTLHFAAGGSFRLSSSGTEGTGNWSIIRDGQRQEVVILDVASGKAELNELAGQWKVTGKSPDVVLLTSREDSTQLFRIRRTH